MKRYKIAAFIMLLLLSATFLRAEKLVELNITKEEWQRIEHNLKTAEFSRKTEKGIAILLEDEEIPILQSMGLSFTVIEDLTEKKKLYYTGKSQYHTFDQMKTELINLANTYSNIAKLDTIGFSSQGRPILCLKISNNPAVNQIKPKMRIVGATHGNEWIGAEVAFLYGKYLLENYASDQEVRNIVNNREIYIIPIFNPDGHVAQTRYNSNGVDLNRNFGYIKNNSGNAPYSEVETRAMHQFSKERNFNLSLSFHSGAVYVNYIWNYTPVRSADDRYNNFVRNMSQLYGNLTGYPITEGYDWYQTLGDLNDYSYGINGDIDWTIEVSNSYIPDPSQIDPIFNANMPAMNLFARKLGQGIGGVVIDSLTGDTIKTARITIYPINWPIWTDKFTGDFIRPLLPGTYSIKVEAPGYTPKTITNLVVQSDTLTWVTVYLTPSNDGKVNLFKPELIYINASNSVITTDTFMTHYSLGDPDGLYFTLGVGGYAIFDLGREVRSDTIYVFEGNDGVSNEGFKLFISNSPYSSWTQIGNIHYGNAVIPVSQNFRYIKIEDDGDGSSSTLRCGYDLDAIVVKTKASLELLSYIVEEESGNNDGIVNGGETGRLTLELKNTSVSPIQNLVLKPQIQDPYVNFIEDSLVIEGVLPNQTINSAFTFSTSTNMPYDHQVQMSMLATFQNVYLTYPITFTLNTRTQNIYTGPDGYGYYGYDTRDSSYSEFEPFSFIDISSVGSLITQITDRDDATTQLNLPFEFRYYGVNYNTISVCSNGWIAMGSVSSNTPQNRPIPNTNNPTALIAPFFTDLDPQSNGDIYYYYDSPNHQFIVMWKNVKIWGTSYNATFEVIFRDPVYYPSLTSDGEIIFLYQAVPQVIDATIGIESPNHTTGLQCYYNGTYDPSIAPIHGGGFIKFTTDTPAVVPVTEPLATKITLRQTLIKNTLEFEFNTFAGGELIIYNSNGRAVIRRSINPNTRHLQLNIKEVPAGVYFARVIIADKNTDRTFKIIKVE